MQGSPPPAAEADASSLRAEAVEVVASLRAYLEWQVESGAGGIPRGRGRSNTTTATPAAVASPAAQPVSPMPPVPHVDDHAPAPVRSEAPAPSEEPAVVRAPAAPNASAPKAPRALDVIRAEVSDCRKCELAASRTNTVFSRGNPGASLCFVGEAPGADEDAQGLPFVGRAGQLLDRMIAAMGLSADKDVYICNILKCRPPDNRRPTPEETETCIPYLHEQLAVVKPRVIVALGNTAVAALLGTKLGITKLRGSWKLYRGTTLVMPTYHPSYLIRPSPQQAEAKRQAWDDLQIVMKELGLALPAKK
jgi:DNA polymerase